MKVTSLVCFWPLLDHFLPAILETRNNAHLPLPCSWEMSKWISLKLAINIPAASPEHPKAA